MKIPAHLQALPPVTQAHELAMWLSSQHLLDADQHLYALMDGAQIKGLPHKLHRLAPKAHGSLFETLQKKSLENAGGFLVDLGPEPPANLLAAISQEALDHPAVLWLQSPLEASVLQRLLALRVEAKLERGPETYLRYYDPRIFTNLIDVLDPAQLPMLSMASHWHWLDHSYQRCTLEIPLDIPAAQAFQTPLQINKTQEQALIEASLPYEVMHILTLGAPALVEQIPHSERYSRIQQGIHQAKQAGQTTLPQFASTCASLIINAPPPPTGA